MAVRTISAQEWRELGLRVEDVCRISKESVAIAREIRQQRTFDAELRKLLRQFEEER